jgi:hypothetical protein
MRKQQPNSNAPSCRKRRKDRRITCPANAGPAFIGQRFFHSPSRPVNHAS